MSSCSRATSASRTSPWTSRCCRCCARTTASASCSPSAPRAWSRSTRTVRAGTPSSARRREADANVMFEPDLKKLDLSARDFVSLESLRAKDSGRIVGPKAAKLGELKSHFPDRVAPGVGIPFGLYRATVLDRPYRNTGKTVYEWMVESFRKLEAMPAGSREAAEFAEKLRAEIYSTILNTDPGPKFREQLRAAMAKEFGAGLPRRRLRALRHERRGPSRFHRCRPQPDGLQHRRLRQHREGDLRGLGVAVHGACVGLATVPHEGARARLPGGASAEDRALGHLRRDGHAGRRHRGSGRACGRGERRRRRCGGRAGGRVGSHRPEDGRHAPHGDGHARPGGWCRRLRAGSRNFPFPEPKHCSRRTRPGS